MRVARLRAAVRQAEERLDLIDGAVLVIEDGTVTDWNPPAALMLAGAAPEGAPGHGAIGQDAAALLGRLLGDCGAEALAAFARLDRDGVPFRLRARRHDGAPIVLSGRPRGGQLLLVVHEAGPEETEQAPSAGGATADREEAGGGQPAPADPASAAESTQEVARATLPYAGPAANPGLVAEAMLDRLPMAAWSRDPDGSVAWSRGRIATRSGTVDAGIVAEAASAQRPQPSGNDAAPDAEAEARPFRLEFAGRRPGESIAVDAVEVAGPGGTRFGGAIDVTALLSAERNLARFVSTMAETFAHLNVGLAIFDRNQALVMFNPALLQMWQADPAWLARRPTLREIIDRLRANRRIPETADFHRWRRRLTDLFSDTETAEYEELWHLADGSDIRVLARPHPHGSLAFVFDDVTERLRLEQQFRHSIDLRRATLDRLDEALAVFGPDGLLQFVNAAFHDIWGTDGEAVRPAMHARELVPLVAGLTVETDVWRRVMAFVTSDESREPWSARLTLGSGHVVRARFAPLPDGSTLAAFLDVTDSERFARALHERNEVLEAAEEMRSAVLEQISHRLRTPLNTLFGFSQLIADQSFGPLSDSQRGYAEGILEAARQLLASVDEVTDLAALEIDPTYDEDSGPALGETMMLTGRLLEKRAAEAGVRLRVTVPGGDCDPECDPRRLRQIVFGLATEAIGRCGEGGGIELGAEARPDEMVEIRAQVAPGAPVDAGTAADDHDPPTHGFLRRLAELAGGAFELRGWSGPEPSAAVLLRNRAGWRDGEAEEEIDREIAGEYDGATPVPGSQRTEAPAASDAEEGHEPAGAQRGAGGAR